MSHEITIRSDNTAEFAHTGPKSAIWHGLGQELEAGADINTWKIQAGLDWEVFESAITFQTIKGGVMFPDRKALFRSDTHAGLSLVGQDFKVVQPGEILEFFRDLTERHGMVLSTAGSLFGGKRFWALAETGKAANIVDGDEIKGHLLLTTAVDGTLATTAKFVSERVVCNNTLTVALAETGKNMIKKTHKVDFDPAGVKIDLGLVDKAWETFIGNLKKMTEKKMTDDKVLEFYQKIFFKPDVAAADQSWGVTRKIDEMVSLYNTGAGADLCKGTAWGVLNAVTNGFTHGSGKRNPSHQFWESYYGANDTIKTNVYNKLLQTI